MLTTITHPSHIKNPEIYLVASEQIYSSHRRLVICFASEGSRFKIVWLSCGKSISFSACVPFHFGYCIFLSFEVRFETKGKRLAL